MPENRYKAEIPEAPDWLKRAEALPESPGVYLMRDRRGRVVYVGKAVSLRNRVRNYFQAGSSDYRAFIRLLSGLLGRIDSVVTATETEALLLERELIRKHKPRFNVIWRDDKQFLSLRVDTRHAYPRVEPVRQFRDDGARYFGPFASASAVRESLRVVNAHFQLRSCSDAELARRKRPCLEYQIKRCPGPCIEAIPPETYQEGVDSLLLFLEGKTQALLNQLNQRMWQASEAEDFEAAARLRDQLRAVQATRQPQDVIMPGLSDADVIALFREGSLVAVTVIEVRRGRTEDVWTGSAETPHVHDAELLESVLSQRYLQSEAAEARHLTPSEFILQDGLVLSEGLKTLLSRQAGRRLKLITPRRGLRKRLLRLAEDNARHHFQAERSRLRGQGAVLDELKTRLHLQNRPERMECYDISHFQGREIVASKVSFLNGKPDKSAYRRFRVKGLQDQDDFASMYQVLSRRFKRALEETEHLPDLVVIDGGKGQLNVARLVFKELGIEGVDLIGLAKSRLKGQDDGGKAVRSEERVFRPGARDPIVLTPGSRAILLLAWLRDEAHRFAITFNRERRAKQAKKSELDAIPGLGPSRQRALLSHLGSVRQIARATEAELRSVPGIGPKAARAIYQHLHSALALAVREVDSA